MTLLSFRVLSVPPFGRPQSRSGDSIRNLESLCTADDSLPERSCLRQTGNRVVRLLKRVRAFNLRRGRLTNGRTNAARQSNCDCSHLFIGLWCPVTQTILVISVKSVAGVVICDMAVLARTPILGFVDIMSRAANDRLQAARLLKTQ